MESLRSTFRLWALLSCVSSLTSAQAGTVLSTFIYTHHGERTPWVLPDSPHLTPLGAQQAWQAGRKMRNRYIQPVVGLSDEIYTIRNIQSTFLQDIEVNILASTDQWNTASAQAFMQGLYPPLTDGQNNTTKFPEEVFANGTNIVAPLGGYQYANIAAASPSDPRSISVEGAENCPQFDLTQKAYFNSTTYNDLIQQSQPFFDRLDQPLLDGVFIDSAIGYWDAYYIWDYLSYGYVHNTTVRDKLSPEDYEAARLWAGHLMLDMYANATKDQAGVQNIRTIAGQALAYQVVQSFDDSIRSQGRTNKMDLVFGDYKPMMSFAALAGLLQERTGAFFYAPEPGSSLVFELLTEKPETSPSSYPKTTDMSVRFYYSNTSDTSTDLQQYPLFNLSPSQSTMTYAEFMNAMSGIMIDGQRGWCQACASQSIFCPAATTGTQPISNHHSGLQPAVAGVIGAMVALAFVAIVVGLVMAVGGVRFYRQSRQSELGGFKGTEKLASDQDLTVPKGGAGVTVTEGWRGHERIGSWELKDPVNINNISPGIDTAAFGRGRRGLDTDDTVVDPYAQPVHPRDTV